MNENSRDSVCAVWGEMVERNWLHVCLSSTVCASEFMQSNLNTSLCKSVAIGVVVQVATATVVVRRKSVDCPMLKEIT